MERTHLRPRRHADAHGGTPEHKVVHQIEHRGAARRQYADGGALNLEIAVGE